MIEEPVRFFDVLLLTYSGERITDSGKYKLLGHDLYFTADLA